MIEERDVQELRTGLEANPNVTAVLVGRELAERILEHLEKTVEVKA